MGFLGKIVGGTLGFAIGGPLGALAGAVFGHSLDRSSEFEKDGEYDLLNGQNAQAQLTFFVGAFSMLAKLARSDGHLSPEEIESVEKFMAVDLSLDPESRRVARGIFNKALQSEESFQDYAVQFYQQFHGEPHLLEMMVDIMLRVSFADGGLASSEESLILSATQIFRVNDKTYANIRAKYSGHTIGKYYQILDAQPGDSEEHIKKQYRKLVSEYHPDKIASKGLPEPFIQFANEKFREIQDAYDHIKAQRGIK